jgi:hypothetical protein
MPSQQPIPRIEVTTDGGFVGRGIGGVVIDGTTVTATDLARTCKGELTPREEVSLSHAIAKFKDSGKSPAGHPDEIGYTLVLAGQSTSWHGETAPPGAAAVFKSVWRVRQRVLDDCQ